jgi:hypothetical protein
MQDNPITDSETDSPYIDEEDWQVAFEPYEGELGAALTLAFHLAGLKRCITTLDMHEAIGAIDGPLTLSMSTRTFVVLAANCLRLLSRANLQLTEKRYCVSWD